MADRLKILVVDDEPDLVEILRFSLEEEGFQVLKAFDGEAGLKIALEELPDIIILDVNMPKMNGFEVCKEVKSNEKSKHIPVLMFSAYAQKADIEKGLALGADAYVAKPCGLQDFTEMVKNVLSGQKK